MANTGTVRKEASDLVNYNDAFNGNADNEGCSSNEMAYNIFRNKYAQSTIPLIFHIFHKDDVGKTGRLSISEIEEQADSLNAAYANDIGYISNTDTEIDFQISAIIYHENNTLYDASGKSWHNEDYDDFVFSTSNAINIMVTYMGSSGFGFSPLNYPALAGGDIEKQYIIIDYRTFPGGTDITGYEGGKLLAHEIGHYLGFPHPWQTGACNFDPSKDNDRIPDTPVYDGSQNVGTCPGTAPNTCDEGAGDEPDPFHNIMTRFSDDCRWGFTPGQKTRMKDTLADSDILLGVGTQLSNLFVESSVSLDFTADSFTEIYLANGIDWEISGSVLVEDGEIATLSGTAEITVSGSGDLSITNMNIDYIDVNQHGSAGSLLTFGDGMEFNTDLSSARVIDVDGPLELEGTVELAYVTMDIAYGITVNIENGETLKLTGASSKPTAVNVYGLLYGYSGGEVTCSGSNAEIFAKNTGAQIGVVDFDQAGFVNNMATCTDSCVAPDGGEIYLSSMTVENGGFLGIKAGAYSKYMIEDSATIIYESDARNPEIEPGSVIELGSGAKIIFDRAVDIGNSSLDSTIFRWKTPDTKWGWIELRADGNHLKNISFQGGDKTIYVRSTGNVFDSLDVRDGTYGVYAGPDYVSGNSEFYLQKQSVIEDNDGVGVYAYQSNADINETVVQNNGDEGIYIMSGTGFMEFESANNQVLNNGSDEIGVYSSGQLYAGGGESDGNSNILDGSDYLINNSTAYTALAENNWWGTSSPTSGLFNGTVDYNPYLGSAVSFRVSGSDLLLRDRIIAAQRRIMVGKGVPSGEDVADLYVLQGSDRFDELGLRATTFAAITSLRKAYVPSNEGARVNLQNAAERAILVEIREALASGQLRDASELADLYEREMGLSKNQVEFLILKAGIFGQQKRYSDVLRTVEELRPLVVDERLSFGIENIARDSRSAIIGSEDDSQALEFNAGDFLPQAGMEETEHDGNTRDNDGRTKLEVAYPNPFNPQTTIPFELAESAQVRIVVHDILGRQLAVLVDGTLEIGKHHTSFDASKLPSGVYIIRARFTSASGDVKQFSERIVLQK